MCHLAHQGRRVTFDYRFAYQWIPHRGLFRQRVFACFQMVYLTKFDYQKMGYIMLCFIDT